MTTCPNCELPLHDGETCEHALGRALAVSSREITTLREQLALLAARRPVPAPAPRWRGTLRG